MPDNLPTYLVVNLKINFYNFSRTSNIAFLTDSAETVDLDFGLIHQNISFKKASFHY
jgi:hypothetical protein